MEVLLNMSIVLLGGHERMTGDYKKICKNYKCNVKIFNHHKKNLFKRIGNADYIFILTDTISHKAVINATKACTKRNINMIKLSNSSVNALSETFKDILS